MELEDIRRALVNGIKDSSIAEQIASVGVDTNLHDIGIDSVTLVEMQMALEECINKSFPCSFMREIITLQRLLEHATS